MSTFNPAQPAILHERLFDQMVPWTGEFCEEWKRQAEPRTDGVVEYDGLCFDGWGNPLDG